MSKKAVLKKPKKVEHPYIERKPGVCGGEPIIKGTRISVRLIVGWDRMGQGVDEIVAMYPHLTYAQVYDALSYYYDHQDEIEELITENSQDVVRKKYNGAPWIN